MNHLWQNQLSDEQKESLLQNLADKIIARRLQVPAILFLEMHKPLANVAASASVVLSPFLVPFIGLESMNDYSQVFSERSAWDRLVIMLEDTKKELSA
jgi:hypothetical protein